MMRALLSVVVLHGLLGPFLSVGWANLVLLDQSHPPCPIVIPQAPRAGEDAAATELASYLQKITGAEFKIQRLAPTNPIPSRAIVIGRFDGDVPADLGSDGYVFRTRNQRLELIGGERQGTMYSVYGFLEEVLGCRWWSHNEEEVPKRAAIRLDNLDVVVRPPFSMHDLFNREAQNDENNFALKSRSRSSEKFSGNHTLCPMLKRYTEKHPEFLPMNAKGVRAYNDLHMDYSAPGMPEALAEALGEVVEANGRDIKHIIYFAGMGDWYGGMCECPECKKVYEEETWTDPDGVKKPGYTATLLRMINRTAEILDRKYPGIRVGTFAYMSLEAPPAKTKPRDNVVLWVPRLRHDTVLSVLESEKNKSFLRNVEQWQRIAPGRVYIWEYGANFSNFLFPFPCVRSMAENIKLYRKLGVRGIMIQGNYAGTGSDMVVLKNYVWRKLLWNPRLKTDQVIREFCKGYYGPAAAEVAEYVDRLENSVRQPKQIHANEFAEPLKTYLTKPLMSELRLILQRALARTSAEEEDPYHRRVCEAMASIEAAELWHQGPLEERDDKLVRADLNEYTYPRAETLVRHLRGGGTREWGTGRSHQMSFLTWHGGPLPRLVRGPVEIAVAPVQLGRLWRVSFAGHPIVEGSYENLNAGAWNYQLVGQPETNRIVMRAELGIGNWSPETKQIARKTVQVADDGAIRITGVIRQVSAAAGYSRASAEVLTPYPLGTNLAGVTVELLSASNQWQTVDWSPDKAEVALFSGLKGLKLTFPSKACIVTDQYLSPLTNGGTLAYDKTNGVLTTHVALQAVEIPQGKEATYLDRELRILPSR